MISFGQLPWQETEKKQFWGTVPILTLAGALAGGIITTFHPKVEKMKVIGNDAGFIAATTLGAVAGATILGVSSWYFRKKMIEPSSSLGIISARRSK